MRRNHLDAVFSQLLVQWITVVSTVADQILRLRFYHVEVEAQLHQADFVVVRRMRADGERQAVAIDNRHDFHAFPALRFSNFRPATLGHDERRIDEAFFFIQRAFVAKIIGNVRQNPTQNLVAMSRSSSQRIS